MAADGIKEILQQYIDLKEEKKDREAAVGRLEEYIKKLEEDYYVEDSVSGGEGGQQHYKIRGVAFPLYDRKMSQLELRKAQLGQLQEKIDEQIILVEKYIAQIEDSRMRRMITYRYVDGLAWFQVAQRMGGRHTADGCRMAVERFLQ